MVEQQGETDVPPLVAPMIVVALYAYLVFIVQIIRAVMENMSNSSNSTTLVASTVPPVLIITTPTDNVVTLVWIVRSLRDIGRDLFQRDQDMEIAGRWINNIKKP